MIDPLSNRFFNASGQHGPVMLMYHAVSAGDGVPNWTWAVSIDRFRQQLDLLQRGGWRTVTMQDLAASPEAHPPRTAVITFDDGYIDNLAAFDELRRRGMRATWFIVTGSIGREPQWPGDGRPSGRLLNDAELREMEAAGMEIGSHTVNHVRLTELDDPALASELGDSKSALENALGHEIASFAYPYGAWDERCAEAARAAGYAAACTTRTGWACRDGDPYRLRRLSVFNHDSAATLARKLYFGSHDVSWAHISRYTFRRLTG